MSEYEALTKMGIRNPDEIARYHLYSVDSTDTLRIVYNRKKGSFLPVSRKYRFPQIKRSVLVDGGTGKAQVMFESSAELRNAVAELDRLTKAKDAKSVSKETLANEIRLLEEDVNLRISRLKELVDQLPA